MVSNALRIESLNLDYDLFSTNSNALIHTLLKNAGLPDSDVIEQYRLIIGGDLDLDEEFGIETGNAQPQTPVAPTPLSYYNSTFGGGGGGFTSGGSGSAGGGFTIVGSSGEWRYSSVEIDGVVSGGWYWHEHRATRIRPVVLDLDGDGAELTSAETSPGFDFLGEGVAKTMGWFTGGDALLVHDVNGNGFVDNGAEISFIHHAPGSASDLEALRVFDVNGNGWLDPGDAAYGQFRLWRDANFNGISDPGELTALQATGVEAINLHGAGGGYEIAGNGITGTSAFTRTDGSQGTAYDVAFKAFSRGTRLVSESADWTVLATENGEEVGVLRHDSPVYISNLARLEVNGDVRTGYQLGDGADTVSLGAYGDYRFYIDASGGDDRIDFGTSSGGSVIKAGAGNDSVTAGTGDDFIATGQGFWDVMRDWGGDDYFIVQSDNSAIYDHGGTDVAAFERLNFSGVEFYWQGSDLVVASLDGGQRHWIKDMRNTPGMGIEYAMFADRTLSRDELVAFADAGGYRDTNAPMLDPGSDLAAGLLMAAPELTMTEFYG